MKTNLPYYGRHRLQKARKSRLAIIPLTLFLAITPLCSAWAEENKPDLKDRIVLRSGGGSYNVKTTTWRDKKFRHVMRQRFDFSCGSAALASLLTFHYDRPITEKEVLEAMYERGNREKIKREGFSLLDMKNYLESIGLKSNGFRESLDKLAAVGTPAIVLINRRGYLHFVIVQGLNDEYVLLGDPALGDKRVPRDEFTQMWQNGILFVIQDEQQIGQAHFNLQEYWAWANRSAFSSDTLSTNNISNKTLDLTTLTGYF